jgi:hypothetical protein
MQPKRILRGILCAVPISAALSGCAGPPVSHMVTGEVQAIRVAKDSCTWTEPFGDSGRWRAALHDGQWHAWLSRDRDPREPAVGALDVWIRASDGEAGRCNRAN